MRKLILNNFICEIWNLTSLMEYWACECYVMNTLLITGVLHRTNINEVTKDLDKYIHVFYYRKMLYDFL